MLIKVTTEIILNVADRDEAEKASDGLNNGLERAITNSGFPHGDVVDVEVDSYEVVEDEEAEERGWNEV